MLATTTTIRKPLRIPVSLISWKTYHLSTYFTMAFLRKPEDKLVRKCDYLLCSTSASKQHQLRKCERCNLARYCVSCLHHASYRTTDTVFFSLVSPLPARKATGMNIAFGAALTGQTMTDRKRIGENSTNVFPTGVSSIHRFSRMHSLLRSRTRWTRRRYTCSSRSTLKTIL